MSLMSHNRDPKDSAVARWSAKVTKEALRNAAIKKALHDIVMNNQRLIDERSGGIREPDTPGQ